MPNSSAINQTEFRRILSRNVVLPLVVGVASAILFLVLIFNLLAALKWVEHTEEVIGKANELTTFAVDMQTGMRGFLIVGEDNFLSPYRTAKPKFIAELRSLKELVKDNPPQVERLVRIETIQTQWDQYAQSVINVRRAGGDYQTEVRNRGAQEFNEIRDEFNEFISLEERLLRERNATSQLTTWIAVIAFFSASLILTGLLSFFGRRDLLRLSNTFGKTVDELHIHTEKLEQQAWQRTGQTLLAEQSIGQVALPILGRTVLDFLALYINAAVAAIYVRNEVSGGLSRVATYGVSKDNSLEDGIIEDSDSLVGQTAFSKRIIHLENLPEDYLAKDSSLKVASGLGRTSPTNLVLVPIDHEGKINGVLELGFLNTPTQRELDFLKLITSNIGATFNAAIARQRLQDVLEETQQLNEELQVQQEELRAANEELEEQSRALEESQATLENQKAELEQSNEKLIDQSMKLDHRNAELRTAQVELEERAQDLQRASKYKSEFLANMSHELRTPLNSSMILAKLLAENSKGNLNDEQIEFSKTIYSAGNDLLNLINDILDISKVEAGKLELTPEHFSLPSLVDSLRMTFAPLAHEKALQFNAQLADNLPTSIFTDQQRIEQILKNLLSNAIKFTESGTVGLSVSVAPKGGIAFAVTDTGIGIREDQQAIIFEAFQQADGSISRRYGGTGLGLSISRDLAKLLGGSVHVSSETGKGSTFTLIVPEELSEGEANKPEPVYHQPRPVTQSPVPAQAAAPTAPSNIATSQFADDRHNEKSDQRTALVVEDDTNFAQILYALAHDLKYRCIVAQTAGEALQLANEFIPDAILLDLGLPDASGMTVLQKLKSAPTTRHIPTHIISAADSVETALQMGAIGYAVKPTTRERLQEVFEKLEGKLSQKVKRVLLVEDDKVLRESVVKLIGDDDVDITAVEFGQDALDLLKTTIFDCMIIDLKLPDMHGHELLKRMSTETICCFPPVIVYTGRNLTREEESELMKYSRSIIIKGARSPERLLDEVTLFLHKVESTLSNERQSMLKTVRGRDRVLEGRRVLVVDDDVRNIFALSGALEQKGAVVEIARNGFESISKLNEVPDIDMVLMDVMMPGMDGLEAMRQIRTDPRFQKLPIIAVTAKAMKDDQEQCLKAGASDYLAKPIDIDRLYSLLRVWMPTLERI
ncbi:MAG: response regulator [Gammaproteobacteria bacterium]|nr:MAG: response regulator [Gammaproteobacteria bacterium]